MLFIIYLLSSITLGKSRDFYKVLRIIAKYGYSRDHRPDCEQIHIKQRFGIKNCTLVFDRGMVSTENLKYIRHNELSYISAMDKDEIKALDIFNDAMSEAKKIMEIEIEPYTVTVKNNKGNDREVNTFRIKYAVNVREK